MHKNERAADVVRFWRTVEMFSPQSVPQQARGRDDGKDWIADLEPSDVAPWQSGHAFSEPLASPHSARMFTVYGGLFNVSRVCRQLEQVFGSEHKPEDARPPQLTAMFSFMVTADGLLVENSATLSTCAWALHRLRSPGHRDPHWLDGFEADQQAFAAALNKLSPESLRALSEANSTSPLGTRSGIGAAARDRLKTAARQAAEAGAAKTGQVVNSAVASVSSSFTGTAVGGIVGDVAGTFVEKLLSPATAASNGLEEAGTHTPTLWAQRIQQGLTSAVLHRFVAELSDALGLGSALDAGGIRIACSVVSTKDAEKTREQGLLNSLIMDDLATVEAEISSGEMGTALAAYLAPLNELGPDRRIDIRECRDEVIDGVEPQWTPNGRWPTDTAKSLVMGQQFAVNRVLGAPGDTRGIFSVNGPPGTGKTTMLRDVLTGIVVDRAKQLADLDDPIKAFTDVQQTATLGPRYRVSVRAVQPSLTGFEVVLATANNDAAENVSAELPAVDAVRGAEYETQEADYFTQLATHTLGEPAWGLIAAVLGNMSKRNGFVDRFWWSASGMKAILNRATNGQEVIEDWHEAVSRFRKAQQTVSGLGLPRQRVAEALRAVRTWEAAIPRLQEEFTTATSRCHELETEVARLSAQYECAAAEHHDAEMKYRRHPEQQPGCLVSLSTGFAAGRRWEKLNAQLKRIRDDTEDAQTASGVALRRTEDALRNAQHRQHAAERKLNEANARIADARRTVRTASEQWPGTVPDRQSTEEDFQRCAPWSDREFSAARTRLFVEALRLHKTFLFHAAAPVRQNLAAIMSVLQRKVELSPAALRAAWQTLFLVVPMISTTFASLPRLFAGLGREALGWLFVDEAGQATPQLAVSGLWRCQRALIVGDPQQLEPVVNLPLPAQQALREHHGLDAEWAPEGNSVQRVADRLNHYGTFLPEGDGDSRVWVGAPLRLHRRCDYPMFTLCNRIAYGGDLMIYGTPERATFPGENTWIDVRSPRSEGNWVPAEGAALRELLRQLHAAGVTSQQIRVVSPFRQVVKGCRSSIGAAARSNVGTVHTVQGQETDVLILVLGTGPGSELARRWASEKPNLLNVAVSRARHRLYVIGNRAAWRQLPHYRVLAETLPSTSELL